MEICCERWEVTPQATPRLIKHCPSCKALRPFVCAETFRVNAQKKRLDVWLNYRCTRCACPWMRTIIERRPVGTIDPDQLEAFFRDDPSIARALAFDVRLLRHRGVRLDAGGKLQVRRVAIVPQIDDVAPLCIRLSVPFRCDARLDKLLADQLRLSRPKLRRLHEQGELNVWPLRARALREPIRDGQRIQLGTDNRTD